MLQKGKERKGDKYILQKRESKEKGGKRLHVQKVTPRMVKFLYILHVN